MAREANLFTEAWGGVSSFVVEGQCENRDSKGFSKIDLSRLGYKPENHNQLVGTILIGK